MVKAKRDQGSMQAQKVVGGLSMPTPFLKIGSSVFAKKDNIFQFSLK